MTTQKTLIYLPIICHYQPEAQFVRSLIRLLANDKYQFVLDWIIGDSLIPRARNEAAHRFLFHADVKECEAMVFIDCDITFTSDDVAKLLEVPADISCGFYPKKNLTVGWVCNTLEGEKKDADGRIKLLCGGTGFMKITRAPLLAMIEKLPEIAFKHDEADVVQHDLFPIGVVREDGVPVANPGRYLSEDWFFCYRARELGYPIVGDTRISLKHTGTFTFPPTLAQVADSLQSLVKA